ncbi:MAG: ribosomal protein S18-alanine N-acetyltransferase [Acidobacteriota bacterium]|nr:ribosomal protein S18-alanine N-acetyltransferase [Acidobacteriota bacterium]
MAGLIIERAAAEDLAAIHDLEQRCFPAPWRREFFESEICNPGRFNLVARRDGGIVGYLFAAWIVDEMHINKVAVDERARRQGIAFALMERCTAFGVEHGVTSIWLEVRQSNRDAQEFYRVLDFEAEYIRKGYYPDGEAAVVMTKDL